MNEGEMRRIVRLDRLPGDQVVVEASTEERAGLAARFDLPAIAALRATVALTAEGEAIIARGRLNGTYDQACAIAGDPFTVTLDEPLAIRFVPALAALAEDEEHEFAAGEPDEVEYSGSAIDLGEAIAQSFGLAIDPYATGPGAEAARRDAGLDGGAGAGGPFAALAALKNPD